MSRFKRTKESTKPVRVRKNFKKTIISKSADDSQSTDVKDELWNKRENVDDMESIKLNYNMKNKRISWIAVESMHYGYIGRWKIFKVVGKKVFNRLPGFKKEFFCLDVDEAKAKCEAVWLAWLKGLDEVAEV